MANIFLVLVLLTNFRILSSSRMAASIYWIAVQGVLLGLFALSAESGGPSVEMVGVSVTAIALKGVIFPRLLFRAVRDVQVRKELKPYVGYVASMLIGLLGLVGAMWLGAHLNVPIVGGNPLVMQVALFSIFAGVFMIISRKMAVMQVVGYLAMGNGIYVLGLGSFSQTSFLIEIGVLLDLFVAVFLMGITIDHIQRAFGHVNSHELRSLKG